MVVAKQFSTVEQNNDGKKKKILVEAFRWTDSITNAAAVEGSDECSSFPVLLRAMAPPPPRRRRPVDLVLIPYEVEKDVGNGTLEKKMRKAMRSMADCLDNNDCVSLKKGSDVNYTELTEMASGKIAAKIDHLKIAEFPTVAQQVSEAYKVLKSRSPERSKGRQALIVLLPPAIHADDIKYHYPTDDDFPVLTFPVTNAGDDDVIPEKLEERAKAFLRKAMTPIAATDVRITIETFSGVTVPSILGPAKVSCSVHKNLRSGEIDVGSLYAGEEKKFLVNLTVPKEVLETEWGIMKVQGRYREAINADDGEVNGNGGRGGDDDDIEIECVFVRMTKMCPP